MEKGMSSTFLNMQITYHKFIPSNALQIKLYLFASSQPYKSYELQSICNKLNMPFASLHAFIVDKGENKEDITRDVPTGRRYIDNTV